MAAERGAWASEDPVAKLCGVGFSSGALGAQAVPVEGSQRPPSPDAPAGPAAPWGLSPPGLASLTASANIPELGGVSHGLAAEHWEQSWDPQSQGGTWCRALDGAGSGESCPWVGGAAGGGGAPGLGPLSAGTRPEAAGGAGGRAGSGRARAGGAVFLSLPPETTNSRGVSGFTLQFINS